MNIFQVSLSRLQTLYSFSKKISIIDSAKRASTQRTIALEKMLEKILLHDHSILVLLSVVPEQIQEFDVSLIASAARNIMETANIYFHISQRGIDTDTIKFRVETMALNEIYNEIDITKKLGFSQDCVHAQINHFYYNSAPDRFQKFPQFTQLSTNEQAHVLSGRKSTFQMISPHILPEQMESAIYNLLSNSIHSLPLGLSNNSINHSSLFSSFFHEERLLVIALQVGYIYTAHVVKDYLNLRKPLYSLLTPEEKKALNSYVSIGDLENYIHTLRAEYEKNPFAL